MTLAVLILSQWSAIKAWVKMYFPVRYVRVEGVFQHLAKDEIKQCLEPWVNADFISLDLLAVRRAVLSLPWAADAEVRRIWPDTIDIHIDEQKPFMRWGTAGLLNERGDVFVVADRDNYKDLPLLICPQGQQRRFLEIMKGLQHQLMQHALILDSLVVSERLSWQLRLSNGMQMKLGRREPLKNLQRFLKTLSLIGLDKIKAIASVDMRYPNGYAVNWKPGVMIDWDGR